MRWRVIDGCPDPASIAPYHYLVLRRAGQTATSIGRGSSAGERRILHAHGKMDQAEIHADPRYARISNPAGFSEHERKSDGAAANNGIPRGANLPVWMQGVDSGGDDAASKERIREAAAHFGWSIEHPYTAGVEGHHWRFDKRPRPNRKSRAAGVGVRRIIQLRRQLPRS